ncbi:hypothetical protein [Legionella tunisiensis]|uniref:hypothetical protein n=1 Tax=Legionella tunisiensis TaxID=1034944 RepID=UPI00035D03E1|nr:hypothetical protein [Legionella tunisiensis]
MEQYDRRDDNGHHNHHDQQYKNISAETVFDFLGFCTGVAMLAVIFSLIKEANKPRETPIIAKAIDGYDEVAEDSQTGKKGTLNGGLLSQNDEIYLVKGAQSREQLIREFVISTALNLIDSEAQPKSALHHTRLDSDSAQYRTMSHIRPKSMDLEDFISKNNWQERLRQKPLVGFERALAFVGLIAGQQDCKFSNMIITEYDHYYVVGVIDHELSGVSFWKAFNRRELTTDFNGLISYIRDLHANNGPHDKPVGMTGDPRAHEFANFALNRSMDKQAIVDLYLTIATNDFITPTIAKLEELSELTDLVNQSDIRYWKKELTMWQQQAKQFVVSHEQEKSQSNTFRV